MTRIAVLGTRIPELAANESESEVQIALIEYIAVAWPHYAVIAKGDSFNGLQKLSPYVATKAKRMGNLKNWPDFQLPIARPPYIGLFLELKKLGTTIYKQNGELVANEHIQGQAALLKRLRGEGHFADFAIGFEHARKLVDWYITLPK